MNEPRVIIDNCDECGEEGILNKVWDGVLSLWLCGTCMEIRDAHIYPPAGADDKESEK